jgi:hypothetical protein
LGNLGRGTLRIDENDTASIKIRWTDVLSCRRKQTVCQVALQSYSPQWLTLRNRCDDVGRGAALVAGHKASRAVWAADAIRQLLACGEQSFRP